MKTKKSLGQHFLKSERALLAIVRAGSINPGDIILEIGPGMGALTEKLLATGYQVLAIEKDDKLYEFLKTKFEKYISLGKLKLIHGDALEFNPQSYQLEPRSYKLISNIPYNITGAILKKFLETDYQPKMIVLLIQKEVAKRIVAQDSKESILSISIKAYGTPKYIETVKAGSFAPAPKVDSAIIAIENISKKFFSLGQSRALTISSEKDFFRMVRAGFKSKRKKLSSNLSTMFDKNTVRTIFQQLNLDDNLRAEDVEIETWGRLANHLR